MSEDYNLLRTEELALLTKQRIDFIIGDIRAGNQHGLDEDLAILADKYKQFLGYIEASKQTWSLNKKPDWC